MTVAGEVGVVHIIAALGPGGAERQLQSVVAHSPRPTQVIALYGGGIVADALAADGHPAIVLGGGANQFFALVRQLRAMRPAIVHVHLLAAQLWGILAARLAGVPVVISSEHSLMDTSIENRPLTPWLRVVYRILERLSTHTVAVSPATRDRLLRWGVAGERISVVENGVDFDALAYSAAGRDRVRAEFGIETGATVIGGVGRLEPVKRFDELIDGLAPGLRTGEWTLLLVGAGPQHDELLQRAVILGVADKVVLTGPRSDMAAILSAMDVMVSTSRDETFGLAVIEALGSGQPVVYAQCPALERFDDAVPEDCHPLGLSPTASAEQAAVAVERTVRLALGPSRPREVGPPAVVRERFGIGCAVDGLESVYVKACELVSMDLR